jgi:probable F420-dependent oxidoreductase
MRPFRFAVQAMSTPTMTDWRSLARMCEDLGYSCLFVPDHFGDQFAPIVAMTVAAEATTTLRVGTLVLDNDYRHPAVLAKEIATLDLSSGGRVELGLGAGWLQRDYDQSGLPLDPPAVRVERMLESLAIIKGLWRNETFSYAGAHYTVNELPGLPRPRSTAPTLLVGGGSRRVLSIAAREADIVGVNADLRSGYVGPEVIESMAPERWDARLAWVREAAGPRFDALDVQVLTFLVMVGIPRAKAVADAPSVYGIPADVAVDLPIGLVGTVDEICDVLVARRARWGFNYVVVHPWDVEAFAPVVERLAGH